MNESTTKNRTLLAIQNRNLPHTLRILCAEDDLMVSRTIAIVLARAGNTVLTVDDGQKAWEALQAESFDLLITDNDMPRLCGEKLVIKVRQHGLNLPIIVTSSQLDFFLHADNQWLQISKALQKPFNLHELTDAVGRVLKPLTKSIVPANAGHATPNNNHNGNASGLNLVSLEYLP